MGGPNDDNNNGAAWIFSPINKWTGAVSTDWATAGNWLFGVPTSATDALIPNTTRKPIVTSMPQVQNLTINAGASVSVTAGYILSVYGNFTNNGLAAVGLGEIDMMAQDPNATYTLSGTTNFMTVGLRGTGTVTIGSNAADKASIGYQLYVPSGTFNTNNKLTMLSTSVYTASIYYGTGGSGAIQGSITMKRYVPGAYGYHHICSPIRSSSISAIGGITLSGPNGAQGSQPGQAGSLATYCEPCNTGPSLNTGYYNYTSPSNSVPNFQGMSALLSGGTVLSFTGGLLFDNPNASANVTVTNSGAPIVGGWNFIGNPLPAPLSWSAFVTDNIAAPFTNSSCYTWVPTSSSTGSWHTFNGTGATGGASNAVAIGEGFFVQVNAGASLSFTTDQMIASATVQSFKTDVLANEIRLTLTSATESAEALSYTEAGRSTGMDAVDAVLPPSMGDNMSATSIAFASDGQSYLIHVIGSHDDNTVMPVAIHTTTAGTYTISASSLNVNGPAYLLDRSTGKYYDLSTESVSFASAGDEDHGNYSVVFKKSHDAAHTSDINIYGKTGAIVIEQSAGTSDITVTNMLGQVITKTTTNTSMTLPIETSAIYLVSVKQNGIETIKKVFVK